MLDDLAGRQQMIQFGQRIAGRRPRDLDLLGFRRIVDLDQKHEPVQLGLGQRVGAFLLDRVLRRQHQERRLQLKRLPSRRDLVFLHGFEHRRLRLRRGAVDLVRQHDVGEHRPVTNSNSRRPPAPSCRISVPVMSIGIKSGVNWMRLNFSDMVSASLLTNSVLASPGTPISKACPREQTDRQPLDHVLLADDHPRQLLPQPVVDVAQMIDGLNVIVAQPLFRLTVPSVACVDPQHDQCTLDSKADSPLRRRPW